MVCASTYVCCNIGVCRLLFLRAQMSMWLLLLVTGSDANQTEPKLAEVDGEFFR